MIEAQEVLRRMSEQDKSIETVRNDVSLQTGALQRVENTLAEIKLTLGKEEEDGKGGYVGTGIIGRTRRNERAVNDVKQQYLRWRIYLAGFASAGFMGLVAMWWLLSDKLAIVLKAH